MSLIVYSLDRADARCRTTEAATAHRTLVPNHKRKNNIKCAKNDSRYRARNKRAKKPHTHRSNTQVGQGRVGREIFTCPEESPEEGPGKKKGAGAGDTQLQSRLNFQMCYLIFMIEMTTHEGDSCVFQAVFCFLLAFFG